MSNINPVLWSATDVAEFTQGVAPWTSGADLDLSAIGFADGTPGTCRTIAIVGAGGTLVVKMLGAPNVFRTLNVQTGDVLAIQAIAISHTSTCGAVRVFW